jgi:hypothetical protein
MILAVADTNVLIAALVFGGAPEGIADLARPGLFAGEVSLAAGGHSRVALAQIGKFSVSVKPALTLRIIAEDPSDDRVLECAAIGIA